MSWVEKPTITVSTFDILHDTEEKQVVINKSNIVSITESNDEINIKTTSGKEYKITDLEQKRELLELTEKGHFIKLSGSFINIREFVEISSHGVVEFRNGAKHTIAFDNETTFESAAKRIDSALNCLNAKSQTQR